MTEPNLERRYEADRIAARVAEVAASIDREAKDQHLVLMGILKGSSFLVADLARRISSPVVCEYISVRREEDPSQVLQIDFSTDFNVGNRPVLLLKDVVGTGIIENYLTDHFRLHGATLVRLAAIIDKPDDRTTDIVVDYPLFSASGGLFAGYGMEFQGRYAQLPYIVEVLGERSSRAPGQ
jgi:hypoxanthine phosphoribosyltransferase